MKKLNGYEVAKTYSGQERLPAGGYIIKIIDVKYEEREWGDVIILSFDIAEGEYKGFYQNHYDGQNEEDKKWKGKYRLRVPTDDGTQEDEWAMRRFKTIIWSFEESNPGFRWNWDESLLKGKAIGALFNNKEYDFKGRNGFYTNCHSLVPVEKIRSGKYTIPKDTFLKKKEEASNSPEDGFINIPDNIDEELPF